MFHILLQGIYTLYPFINARIVNVTIEDVKVLLTEENPFLSKLSNEACNQVKGMGKHSLLMTVTRNFVKNLIQPFETVVGSILLPV